MCVFIKYIYVWGQVRGHPSGYVAGLLSILLDQGMTACACVCVCILSF